MTPAREGHHCWNQKQLNPTAASTNRASSKGNRPRPEPLGQRVDVDTEHRAGRRTASDRYETNSGPRSAPCVERFEVLLERKNRHGLHRQRPAPSCAAATWSHPDGKPWCRNASGLSENANAKHEWVIRRMSRLVSRMRRTSLDGPELSWLPLVRQVNRPSVRGALAAGWDVVTQ
ncbi:hypothetical protein M433DRAFT_9578 [Acidomyces richmondensis BFW]|nr:MAG: hypothetical protein FE78DRAFT_34288 [Acidomyces sp. 'richmondensis']KYG39930.1 hypothetical protein M433DRAFT_9578 [Acidomyces richmondensis BFW]